MCLKNKDRMVYAINKPKIASAKINQFERQKNEVKRNQNWNLPFL